MKESKWQRFKQGIRDLTPLQQLAAQRAGTIGNIIGITIAWFFLIIKGMWYFSVMMFFIIFLQVIGLIGINQKYKAMIQMEAELKAAEPISESGAETMNPEAIEKMMEDLK